MNNESIADRYIRRIVYILLPIVSTIPICVYIFSLGDIDNILLIFKNGYLFYIPYLFCFTLLFNLNPIRKKVIFMTFLSFLLIVLIGLFFNFIFNYSYMPPMDTNDFQVLFNRSVYINMTLFVVAMLSYNAFNVGETKNISEFFTVVGEVYIWHLIIIFGSGLILSFIIFLISLILGFFLTSFSYYTEYIFVKILLAIFSFIYGLFPYIAYYLYKKTKSIISIYLSRILLAFSLFIIFALILLLFYDEIRPYKNRISFIIYNVLLAFTVLNLNFTRLDLKSSILTKALYLLVPIFAAILDIIILTAAIYRIANYGLTANKLTLLITNIFFLANLIFTSYQTFNYISKDFKNRIDDKLDIVLNTRSMIFIYFYGVLGLIVSFFFPILFLDG